MAPISFGGCFGWLHAPGGNVGGDVAVLICMPLSYDALTSYVSLRLLADQLAAAGYPTLRFDYPGTGDSCDAEVEQAGGHWRAWEKSIDDASDWLRATTGACRLVLCGMRASVLLAAEAAARRDDVAGLMLLAPVLRGQSYIRQLFVEARIADGREPLPGEGLVYREFQFSAATIAAIEAVDLRQARLWPGQKIAICPQAPSRLVDQCVDAWRAAGVEVARIAWDGLEPLVRPNIDEDDTLADFSALLAWLKRELPPRVPADTALAPLRPAELRSRGYVDTPVAFGPQGRLFGMLCRPDERAPGVVATDPVILIVNGGRDPHYGASRQNVALARRLAAAGVASLRMDFTGLGDSPGPPGREDMMTPMFTESRVADIVAALDALAARGFRRFGMAGLCAGAYHAFVAGLADRRLSLLLLLNMPFFTMPGVSAVDHLYWRDMTPMQMLVRLPRWQSWLKLFALRRQIGAILLVQLVKLRDQAIDRAKNLAAWLGKPEPPTFAQNALANLSARGVRTFFVFSHHDLGIQAVESELRCPGVELERKYPGVAWGAFDKLNHDLSHVAGRADAESAMIDFVTDAAAFRDGRSVPVNEASA